MSFSILQSHARNGLSEMMSMYVFRSNSKMMLMNAFRSNSILSFQDQSTSEKSSSTQTSNMSTSTTSSSFRDLSERCKSTRYDKWSHASVMVLYQTYRGTEVEIQLPLKRFPDSSYSFLIQGGWCEKGHLVTKKLAPMLPGIDSCLLKLIFLKWKRHYD